MNYFRDCKTQEEVKAEFKRLAKINHPDKGGSVEVMQMINSEYTKAIKRVLSGSKFTESEIIEEILNAENYKKAVESVIHLDGLIVELCGSWLWVSGLTFKYKSVFKENGFYWAGAKKMWYFRGVEHKSKNTKKLSMEDVRRLHGSQMLNGSAFKAQYIN